MTDTTMKNNAQNVCRVATDDSFADIFLIFLSIKIRKLVKNLHSKYLVMSDQQSKYVQFTITYDKKSSNPSQLKGYNE